MKTISTLESLKKSLPKSTKALILLSSTPNIDSVASALGLSLALQKKNITVQVASVADMRVEFSRLVGVDSVKKKIGNRNLVVSFEYSEEQVEKVSYNISEDGKRFNLVIAPKNNALPLNPDTVVFDYAGAESDLTFLIGVNNFSEIGPLYDEERNVIEGSFTVALTLFPVTTFAKHHLNAEGFSSLSELTASLCAGLELPLEADGASNLLFGMESITQGFLSPTVSAETYETIAFLLRAGAKRQPIGQQGTLAPTQFPFVQNINQPTIPGVNVATDQNIQRAQDPNQNNQQSSDQGQSPQASSNPFAAALNKTAQSSVMPAGYSATGELKG